jgi:hypothetical protein
MFCPRNSHKFPHDECTYNHIADSNIPHDASAFNVNAHFAAHIIPNNKIPHDASAHFAAHITPNESTYN